MRDARPPRGEDKKQPVPDRRSLPGRRSLTERLRRTVLYFRLRLARINATPHQIGTGFASGVFAAFLPLLPLQIVLAIVLAYCLRGSKMAALLGSFVSNPLNTIPLHMAYYQIGKHLSPFGVPPLSFGGMRLPELFDVGWRLYLALSIGALCLSIPACVAAYFLARKAAEVYRKRKKNPPSGQ